jgi:hypothetical protein
MGRLVYVREDREAEPRFSNPPGAARGGFLGDGGMRGGGGPYGSGHGAGAGFGGPPAGGGGRQVYVANVRIFPLPCHVR